MKKTPFFALLVLLSLPVTAGENDYLRPIGRPPEAKAQRRQGGESFPPLPLPATPLRRSEKKRPPSPAALIGKVVWGSYLDYTGPDGMSQRVFDWNMVPADTQQLLRRVKEVLNLEYKTRTVDLAGFSGVPAELPILYFSGGRTIRLTEAERTKLRKYILDGGTLIFDSVAGSPYFYESAVKEARAILPESPVRRISGDHAVYRMITTETKAKMNQSVTFPNFYGVYAGSRLAIIITPFGMGPGWDNAQPTLIRNAKAFQPASAKALGVNLIAYVVGWYETGQALAAGSTGAQSGASRMNVDKIVFTQLKTDGLWNSDPGAENRFMNYLAKNLRIDAGETPNYVDPAAAPLEDYPFVYLSGIGEFKLPSKALSALRNYLNGGGFLFINNSLGMNEFDASVPGLVQALFPGKKLEMIPNSDPIFNKGPFRFTRSGFSEAASQKYPGRDRPVLYGIRTGDRWGVVYSPVDLAGGWLGTSRPGSVVYEPETALRLGADLIAYFMTR